MQACENREHGVQGVEQSLPSSWLVWHTATQALDRVSALLSSEKKAAKAGVGLRDGHGGSPEGRALPQRAWLSGRKSWRVPKGS